MKSIAQFTITVGEDGKYIAEGVDLPIVTQADSLDLLTKNIKEAVDLAFEGESLADLNFSREPAIMVNFELLQAYA